MEKSPGFLIFFGFLVVVKLCLTSPVRDEVSRTFSRNGLLFVYITLRYRENSFHILYLIAEKPTLAVTGAYDKELRTKELCNLVL